MHGSPRPRITEINPHLLCVLCGGYLIDATAITECLHSFCKSCIVRYLEAHKYCPICDVLVHKTKSLQNIRPDHILQKIVYKLVPDLYTKEMKCRREFYSSIPVDQHPSSNDEKGQITDESCFFTLDETIHIILEYVDVMGDELFLSSFSKRYLRCPAAVRIASLQKLITLKYGITSDHDVIIFCDGVQLPPYLTLMDVAYIYSWKRTDAIPLMYQILKPDQRIITFEDEICKPEVKCELRGDSSLAASTAVTTNTCNIFPSPITSIQNAGLVESETRITEANNNSICVKKDDIPRYVRPTFNNHPKSVSFDINSFPTTKQFSILTNVFSNKCIPSSSVANSISCVSSNSVSTKIDSKVTTISNDESSICGRKESGGYQRFNSTIDDQLILKNCSNKTRVCAKIQNSGSKSNYDAINENRLLQPCNNDSNKSWNSSNIHIDKNSNYKCKEINRASNRHVIDHLLPIKKPKVVDCIDSYQPQQVKTFENYKKTSVNSLNATILPNCSYPSQCIEENKIKKPDLQTPDLMSFDVNSVKQIYKEKMLKSSSKPWSPHISNPNISTKLQSPNSQFQEDVKYVKSCKMRNMPRYLGNPLSKIKPMYQSTSEGAGNKTENKNVSNPSPSKKHVPMIKIDPKTLCPIVSSTNISSATSCSSAVSASQCSKRPTCISPSVKHPASIYSSAALLSKTANPNPYMNFNRNSSIDPLLNHVNPFLCMYPSFTMANPSVSSPSSLDYMKAISNLYPTAAFHPSLPPSVTSLFSPHNSNKKQSIEKSTRPINSSERQSINRPVSVCNTSNNSVSYKSTASSVTLSSKNGITVPCKIVSNTIGTPISKLINTSQTMEAENIKVTSQVESNEKTNATVSLPNELSDKASSKKETSNIVNSSHENKLSTIDTSNITQKNNSINDKDIGDNCRNSTNENKINNSDSSNNNTNNKNNSNNSEGNFTSTSTNSKLHDDDNVVHGDDNDNDKGNSDITSHSDIDNKSSEYVSVTVNGNVKNIFNEKSLELSNFALNNFVSPNGIKKYPHSCNAGSKKMCDQVISNTVILDRDGTDNDNKNIQSDFNDKSISDNSTNENALDDKVDNNCISNNESNNSNIIIDDKR